MVKSLLLLIFNVHRELVEARPKLSQLSSLLLKIQEQFSTYEDKEVDIEVDTIQSQDLQMPPVSVQNE